MKNLSTYPGKRNVNAASRGACLLTIVEGLKVVLVASAPTEPEWFTVATGRVVEPAEDWILGGTASFVHWQ